MAAAAAIGNIGRMAGQVFKGLANPSVALPLAAVGVPMAIGGVHGRVAGYDNPTHSGIPGALGYGVGLGPLAGLGYYMGQQTGSKNQMRDFYNQYQPLISMQGYNQVSGNI